MKSNKKFVNDEDEEGTALSAEEGSDEPQITNMKGIDVDKINKEFEEHNNKCKAIHEQIFDVDIELKNKLKDVWDYVDVIRDNKLSGVCVASIMDTYFDNIIPVHTHISISENCLINFVYNKKKTDEVKILMVDNRILMRNRMSDDKEIIRKRDMLNDTYFIPYDELYIIDDKTMYQRLIRIIAFKMVSNTGRDLIFITLNGGVDVYSEIALKQVELDWLMKEIAPYNDREKEVQEENMSYIFEDSDGRLYANTFKIEKADIDIDLQYNDNFKAVSDGIIDRLTNQEKGLVILSGMKGAGKTYYLRFLTKKINKKFVYIPRYFYTTLSSTKFFSFLLQHCKNTILIFEDAEEIVKSRDSATGNYLISDILEMSDGLTNDILKLQMIFTFNTAVENIDDALLRPSRLLANYHFDKLTTEKSNKLLAHLGKKEVVDEPKTLAELYNIDNMPIEVNNKKIKSFGFQT